MPTIEIPDSMVPDGYEATGEFREPDSEDWWISGGNKPTHGSNGWPRVILRRKPVLIRVVLDVTGPKRRIKYGEFYLDHGGELRFWSYGGTTSDEYIPLSNPVQVTK